MISPKNMAVGKIITKYDVEKYDILVFSHIDVVRRKLATG